MDNSIVEVQATYPGGEPALLRFVSENLVYPNIAQEQEIQGTVVLRFRVEKDGSIGEIVIKKGPLRNATWLPPLLLRNSTVSLRLVSRVTPVPVWFTLPIRFQIR